MKLSLPALRANFVVLGGTLGRRGALSLWLPLRLPWSESRLNHPTLKTPTQPLNKQRSTPCAMTVLRPEVQPNQLF